MTLYLCTRSDEQYPRGCIYDYLPNLILPVKNLENAKFLTPSSTVFLCLFLSRERLFRHLASVFLSSLLLLFLPFLSSPTVLLIR